MSQPKYRRRRKLIKPRLQLKLTLIFVGLSALSLLLQFVLFTSAFTNAALDLPHDGMLLMTRANSVLLEVLAVSFLIFLPLTFLIGILTTFRIAGPLYRFEMFLNAVHRGESPPDFRLRKGDELQDLASLLNAVTVPLRKEDDDAAADQALENAPSLVRTADGEASEDASTCETSSGESP